MKGLRSVQVGMFLLYAAIAATTSIAFQVPAARFTSLSQLSIARTGRQQQTPVSVPWTVLRETSSDGSPTDAEGEEEEQPLVVKDFLAEKFPAFYALLDKNEDIWATLKEAENDGGYTVFCPNSEAFAELGEKKLSQLEDPRNLETAVKMGTYHIILGEAVTSERLKREDWTKPPVDGVAALTVGGVKTMGGDVPVGRSKSGGFLGWGAKEDGKTAVVGPKAKISQSFQLGNCIVHEMDGLVSPIILWRYCDQLRIPGF